MASIISIGNIRGDEDEWEVCNSVGRQASLTGTKTNKLAYKQIYILADISRVPYSVSRRHARYLKTKIKKKKKKKKKRERERKMNYTKWTPVDDALMTVVCLSSPLEIRVRFPTVNYRYFWNGPSLNSCRNANRIQFAAFERVPDADAYHCSIHWGLDDLLFFCFPVLLQLRDVISSRPAFVWRSN